MRKIFFIPMLLAGVVFLLADTTTPAGKKKAPSKSATTSGKSTKKPAAKTTAAKKKSTAKKNVAVRKSTPSWRTSQRVPTPDRYKEIPQALATKGYLPPDSPSGVWDTSSVAALKKFQEDQSLEPSGKIDSLSLIALGLGPKHDTPLAPPQ